MHQRHGCIARQRLSVRLADRRKLSRGSSRFLQQLAEAVRISRKALAGAVAEKAVIVLQFVLKLSTSTDGGGGTWRAMPWS
jgi:hypothetical protein